MRIPLMILLATISCASADKPTAPEFPTAPAQVDDFGPTNNACLIVIVEKRKTLADMCFDMMFFQDCLAMAETAKAEFPKAKRTSAWRPNSYCLDLGYTEVCRSVLVRPGGCK